MIKRIKSIVKSSLFKNILILFSGSTIAIGLEFLIQFYLSKKLSIVDFGWYKAFTLYLGYSSLSHFGFKDAIQLKLCSQTGLSTESVENRKDFTILFVEQLFVFIFLIILSDFFNSTDRLLLFVLASATFLTVIISYYDLYYQSIKNFKISTYIHVLKPVLYIVTLAVLYLWAYSLLNIFYAFIISLIILLIIINFISFPSIRLTKINWVVVKSRIFEYKRGFSLLIGNLGHQVNTTLDKLFVSFLFPKEEFAIYSFGAMFFVFTNVLVASISATLLPFLYKDYKKQLKEKYLSILKGVIFLFFLYPIYFLVISLIIYYYWPEYRQSINVLAHLSLGLLFTILITILHNNYFRVLSFEKYYVRINWIVIVVVLFTFILFSIFNIFNISYYAIVFSIAAFLRFNSNELMLRKILRLNNKYLLLVNVSAFIISATSYLIYSLLL